MTALLSAQSKDAERIRDFLVQHTPHKIFLGGACMQCVQLYEDLQKVRVLIPSSPPGSKPGEAGDGQGVEGVPGRAQP